MGMDIKFYIFNSQKQLDKYNKISYEYNVYNHKTFEIHKEDCQKAYENFVAGKAPDIKNCFTDEENSNLEIMAARIEFLEGLEWEKMYGNGYSSYIPEFVRKYHGKEWKAFVESHDTYMVFSLEMIEHLIKLMKLVIDNPSRAFELLPPLDVQREFPDLYQNEDLDQDYKYRYGNYRVKDGKIVNFFDETDDKTYFNDIKLHYKNLIQLKKLLDENPETILCYYESL